MHEKTRSLTGFFLSRAGGMPNLDHRILRQSLTLKKLP